MFALPNLVSKNVTPCVPWTFQANIPAEVRGKEGKKARGDWINNPATQHQVYSGWEGLNETLRISGDKAGPDEENPPFKLHAFVADIDCPVTDDELQVGLNRTKFVPNYFERTLSGNARLVWLLETPTTVPSRKFAQELLDLAATRLKVDQIAPGFDRPAWLEPNRYYTNSGEFFAIDESVRISASLVQGWMLEVAEKHHWKKQKNAVSIPLPLVFAEINKKYPTHNWPGEFVEEAQGPSFWLPNSVSPKSAIVKPTGLFTFSSSAAKAFYSWADLLGNDFVRTYETEMLGKAVEGIYHDGKSYYRNDGYGNWKPFSKEDIISHLATTRGLSTTKQGDVPSDCSRAMEYIRDWHGITGAAPFVFQPPGLIVRSGNRFLNTHTKKVCSPAEMRPHPLQWGEGFPFISTLLDGFFDPLEQLEYVKAWLARFYQGAYALNLESGQNVFILGKAGIGKTFLSQGLLPYLLGGSAEAEDYLLGKTDFNSQLFEVALWTVDDNSATVDAVTHRKFTQITKKMAANTTFQYHEKFRVPCSVDWLGRVLITANDDEESARIVPELNMSNIDKFHLFKASDKAAVTFPNRRECQRIIREETPFLARWLLEYTPPSRILGSNRFGIEAYHEKRIMQNAEYSSRTAGFMEIIEDWRERYFGERKDKEFWEGSAYQLLVELNADASRSAAGVRSISADRIGSALATLRAKGMPFEPVANGSIRHWRIHRPSPKRAVPLPVAPNGLSL
jgi:hypothetical protein